jgi:hypothetical protein
VQGRTRIVNPGQLRSAGISFPEIDRRLETGRLHRIHRGVYAVGHDRLSDHGRWMAAVLAWRQVTRDRRGVAETIRTLLHARSK